jgi:hypothetical protein
LGGVTSNSWALLNPSKGKSFRLPLDDTTVLALLFSVKVLIDYKVGSEGKLSCGKLGWELGLKGDGWLGKLAGVEGTGINFCDKLRGAGVAKRD